jgi:hypothetical protein
MSDPFRRTVAVASAAPSAPNAGTSVGGLSTVDFSAARSDISDAMAGRVTLAMLDLIILALIGFYVATKSAQGGS